MDTKALELELQTRTKLAVAVDHLRRCATDSALDVRVNLCGNKVGYMELGGGDLSPDGKGLIFSLVKARYEYLYNESEKRIREIAKGLSAPESE